MIDVISDPSDLYVAETKQGAHMTEQLTLPLTAEIVNPVVPVDLTPDIYGDDFEMEPGDVDPEGNAY